MEKRKFLFEACIAGVQKDLIFSAPVENGAVITNEYCPQELLTGGLSFVTAINGESLDEFINDCRMQVNVMAAMKNVKSIMDIHIGGLMAAVVAHINRCGRLIFGDFLIYMDCFSYLLAADGFNEKEIRHAYPQVIRSIVELYPDYIKNTADLSPFKGSHWDFILFGLVNDQH